MQDNEHKKKRKSGLHKEISSIFEGVPVPGRQEEPSDSAAREQVEPDASRPPSPEPRVPQGVPTVKAGSVKQSMHKAVAARKGGESRWQNIWLKIKSKLFKSESGASSSRQKVMLLLVPILVIALIYVLMPLFKRPEISRPAGVRPAGAAVEDKREIDWKVPEPYPITLRDPMQASSSMSVARETEMIESGGGGLIVKGIVYSKESPAAVVGNQIVHEGDIVSGASVVKINQDSVEFKINDKRWVQKVQR